MKLEEILQLNRCPFKYDVMGGEFGRVSKGTQLAEEARFALFLRYMDKFIEQCGFQVRVPKWNIYMEKKNIRRDNVFERITGFDRKKREVMMELFKNIMDFCGWGIGKIALKETGQFPEFFPEDAISLLEWENIYSCVPGLDSLEERGFRNITVTVCWNRALYDYHKFSQENEKVIKRYFPTAEDAIAGIMKKIADPLGTGLETMNCYQNHKYVMAFFEANHPDVTVSLLDMDYNFMVQVLILHLLVNFVEKQFGYRQKGELDEKI